MSGLLIKDLELLKINLKTYLAVFLIGLIYLIAQKNGSTFFVCYAIFVSIGVSIGTISYDSYHHGMNFLMTLPVTRKQYVRSKYLLTFGFLIAVSVLSLLLGILKVQISGTQEMADLLISAGVSLALASVVVSGMIPLRLKYEAEKSRVLMVALVAVIFFVASAGRELFGRYQEAVGRSLDFLNHLSGWQIGTVLAVFALICIIISVKVSDHIMEKKEF